MSNVNIVVDEQQTVWIIITLSSYQSTGWKGSKPLDVCIVITSFVYCSQVNCYGSGLQPNGLVLNKPAEFTVDTKKAGNAPLDVKVMDDRCSCEVKETIDLMRLQFICARITNNRNVFFFQRNLTMYRVYMTCVVGAFNKIWYYLVEQNQ